MKGLNLTTIKQLSLFLKDKKFNKIFIICGSKSYKLSGGKYILEKLLKKKIVEYFYKKSPYPEISELKKIIFSLKKFAPDLIIAIGGGSVLDYAKISNFLNESRNITNDIKNSKFYIKKKISKLLALPTTAGSGAEVTSTAVIYIDGIKHSVENDLIKPDYFFLIPELIINTSKKIKSSSGFDAIAQSIESIISSKSNTISLKYAKKSLDLSIKNYLRYLNNPNKINSNLMLIASNLAGEAINISRTTAPHAVSYPFTYHYGISHGHAVSLTLEKFLKFNYYNIKKSYCNFNLEKRYEIIFEKTKTKNIFELQSFLVDLKKKARLESNFSKLGINIKENISKIISDVNLKRLNNNPIKLSKKDLKYIILNPSI